MDGGAVVFSDCLLFCFYSGGLYSQPSLVAELSTMVAFLVLFCIFFFLFSNPK